MNYTLTPSLNRAHKIEAVKAHLNRYADHYMLATCALALAFLAGLFVGEWREGVANDARLESAFHDGQAKGNELAVAAMSESITAEGCMKWWFNNNTTKVGESVSQLCFNKTIKQLCKGKA